MEAMGQRDEPAIIGFGEAITFQTRIGRKAIEERSRSLGQALIAGLRRIDGVQLWTHPDPSRSGAVVSFRPGNLDVPKLAAALYRNDRIGCATRAGVDRPGIRFSPHIYNTMAEVDRVGSGDSKVHASGRVACRSTRQYQPSEYSVTGLSLSNETIGGAMAVTRRRFLTRVAAAGGASLAYEAMTALGLLAAPSQTPLTSPAASVASAS